MNEEIKHGLQEKAGFERQDLGARPVFAFLISLLVGGVFVFLAVWGMYQFLDSRARAHQPLQNPLVQREEADARNVSSDEIKKFPEPRLQRDEWIEFSDFRLKEEQKLNSYGWVDEKNGVVRIPIERAMQLVAQRGLPVIPK